MAVLVAVLWFLTWLSRDSMGLGFFVSMGVIPVFLIVVAYLFFARHFSAFRGLLIAIAVLSAVQYAAMRVDQSRAEAWKTTRAPESPREVGAVNLADFMRTCATPCVEILARTGADVVLGEHTYRLVRGDACRVGALRPMYFEFLKAGYAGMCAIEMPVSQPSQVLTLENIFCGIQHDGNALCDELPRSYIGNIFVVRLEDVAGDRMLDRWLAGKISAVSDWFGFVGLAELRVGDWYSRGAIYSRAIGIQLQGAGVTGDGDLDEVLTEMEGFLNDPATAREAADYLRILSNARGKEDPALLRSHILRLLQSSDSMQVHAGLQLITRQSHVDVRDIRPKIVQLSQSPDPLIHTSAWQALRNIPPADLKVSD